MKSPLTRDAIDHSVFAQFTSVASEHGSSIAIRDSEGTITYNQLLQLVSQMSAALDRDVAPRAPVAIELSNRRSYVAAMLAALCTDRPYVPIDCSYPMSRNRAIITNAGATHSFRESSDRTTTLVPIAGATSDIVAPETPRGPHACAYIVYTSGSTGEPKGVWQNQRGLLHDVWQYAEAIDINPTDVVSMLYSPSVIGSVRDVFGALLTGAQLSMLDLKGDGVRTTCERLHDVTVAHGMPPVLRMLSREDDTLFPTARIIYVAGDLFDAADLATLRAVSNRSCKFYTGIGATECSTLYRHWIINPEWTPDTARIPVGYAIPERTVELVDDDDGKPVTPGHIGRIIVTSEFLAQGYWRTESSRFQKVAGNNDLRQFDTGDYGRIRDDGLFEFHGRADRQTKVRGHRFDPAVLEHALRSQPEVADAHVFLTKHPTSTQITAAVELGHRTGPQDASMRSVELDLMSRMRNTLSHNLIPHHITVVDNIPRLPNYKVDDSRLRRLIDSADHCRTLSTSSEPELTGARDAVLQTWAAAFGAPPGLDSTLAESGADSLQLLSFEADLERAGYGLPRGYAHPGMTPREALARVRPLAPTGHTNEAVVVFTPSGDLNGSRQLVDDLGHVVNSELAATPHMNDELSRTPPYTLAELAQFAVKEVLARHRTDERLVLIGHSSGARVAWEAACQLTDAGRSVGRVIIGDGPVSVQPSLLTLLSRLTSPKAALTVPARACRAARREFAAFGKPDPDVERMSQQLLKQPAYANLNPATARFLVLRKRAAAEWKPVPADIPVIVTTSDVRSAWERRQALGWRSLSHHTRTVPITGGHNVFDDEQRAALVKLVLNEIEAMTEEPDSRA